MNKLLNLATTKIGCGYVWGSQGEILTLEKLNDFKNKFGVNHYVFRDGNSKVDAAKWLNSQVFDCSGLILWCLQELGYISILDDYNAEMFYTEICNPIAKSDLQPGDLLFVKTVYGDIDHIGIYAGNGKTVEAMGTRFGVVEGNINRFNLFGRLKFKGLDVEEMRPDKNWKEIIESVSDSPERWENAINTAVQAAKSDGNLGDLEIFEYLPVLLEKAYKGPN